jgi:hypothetical protein
MFMLTSVGVGVRTIAHGVARRTRAVTGPRPVARVETRHGAVHEHPLSGATDDIDGVEQFIS